MPIGIVIVIALFIIPLIGYGIYALVAAGKRRDALSTWAMTKGMEFSASEVGNLDSCYPEFKCLQQGDNRYGYNVVAGEWGKRPLCSFDYHYETYSHNSKGGRRTEHHHFSAVVITSAVPLQPLFIRPEGFMDKVGAFLGHDDINFESAEFSRKFYVTSPDRKWAFDVLHQRTIEFLLSRPQYEIQFGLLHVVIYRERTFDVAEFEEAADIVSGILDRLPEYVVLQQQGHST